MSEALANIGNLQDFRAAASKVENGTLRLDAEADGIKVSKDSWLGRVVAWIKEKISPDPLARTSREAAHGRFLQAIANHSGYSASDVSRAEALLTTDLQYGKPLSTRRVREVLGQLDASSTEATRQNRVWAEGLVARIDRHVEERDIPAPLDDRSRERLADNIHRAIDEAGRGGARALTAGEAMQIADEAIDAFFKGRAEKPAGSVAGHSPAKADGQAAASAGTPDVAQASPASTRAAESVSDDAVYVDVSREGAKKALLEVLKSAELPKGAARMVEARIKIGTIEDIDVLAVHSNDAAALWVNEKCVDGWYRDALQSQAGTARKAGIDIQEALPQKPPEDLKVRISKTLRNTPEMMHWSDVEYQGKATVGAHVAQSVWLQSPDAAGDRLDPDSVAATPRRPAPEQRGSPTTPAAGLAAAGLDFPADRKPAAEVKRALEGVELPSDVKSKLLQEIDDGEIGGISDLARRSNERTTDWVVRNRMQSWYDEALSAHRAEVGGRLTRTPPGDLLLAVSNHLSDARQLLDYPAVKVQARRLVGSHVAAAVANRGRVDPQPVPPRPTPTQPAAARTASAQSVAGSQEPQVVSRRQILDKVRTAGLPREVRSDIEKRVQSGEIRNFGELARWGNRRTAEWALENRFERWYAEGRRVAARTFDDPSRAGRLSNTPSAVMKYRFSERVAAAPELMAYEAVKDQGRGVVAQHFGISATRT